MVNPYQLLANAIVEEACSEYLSYGDAPVTGIRKRNIIEFFESEWFSELTDINPKWLIEKLEEKCRNHRHRRRRNEYFRRHYAGD